MNDTTIAQVCFGLITIGIVLFVFTYHDEFPTVTLSELLATPSKGAVFVHVDRVVDKGSFEILLINDGNTASAYSPKVTGLHAGDYATLYVDTNGKTMYVYRAVKKA